MRNLKITASTQANIQCYSSLADSIQIWKLPSSLPEEKIDVQFIAVNITGNFHFRYLSRFLNIHYCLIPQPYSH